MERPSWGCAFERKSERNRMMQSARRHPRAHLIQTDGGAGARIQTDRSERETAFRFQTNVHLVQAKVERFESEQSMHVQLAAVAVFSAAAQRE